MLIFQADTEIISINLVLKHSRYTSVAVNTRFLNSVPSLLARKFTQDASVRRECFYCFKCVRYFSQNRERLQRDILNEVMLLYVVQLRKTRN